MKWGRGRGKMRDGSQQGGGQPSSDIDRVSNLGPQFPPPYNVGCWIHLLRQSFLGFISWDQWNTCERLRPAKGHMKIHFQFNQCGRLTWCWEYSYYIRSAPNMHCFYHSPFSSH